MTSTNRSSTRLMLCAGLALPCVTLVGCSSEPQIIYVNETIEVAPESTTTDANANPSNAIDIVDAGHPTHALIAASTAPFAPTLNNSNVAGPDDDQWLSFAAASGNAQPMLEGMEALRQSTFANDGSVFDPVISTDGTTLVFASTQHRPTADIYTRPIDGNTVTQITANPANDVMPAVSPDGKRIAFASDRAGSWDIFVMSTTGGRALRITSDATHELHPSWSPDGQHLVFSRLGATTGNWEMWVTNVATPDRAEFIGYGLFPTWCPIAKTGSDSRDKILYQRSSERADRRFSVWTLDYEQGNVSNPTQVATSNDAALINPEWSPNGMYITYASVARDSASFNGSTAQPATAQLMMVREDGTDAINLTTGYDANLMPAWAKNNRVYFVSNRSGANNIWSVGTTQALLAIGAPIETPDRGIANVPTDAQ